MYLFHQPARTFVVLSLSWFVVIVLLALWHIRGEYECDVIEEPEHAVHSIHARNADLHSWFVRQGGVYVNASEATPPNALLAHVPERDIVTPSGKLLTLLSPSSAIRNFSETTGSMEAVWRLTSLTTKNPSCAPDAWEQSAMHAFETGALEVIERCDFKGESYLRLMKPLKYDRRCEKCHREQDYQPGQIMGALGVYVSLEKSLQGFQRRWKALVVEYLGIFLVGQFLIWLFYSNQRKSAVVHTQLEQDRQSATEALSESERRWQFALEGSELGIWDWSPQTGDIFYSKHWKRQLGFADHEIPNRLGEWEKRVHPDDLPRCHEDLERHLRGETPVYVTEHRMLCKDGTYKWIAVRGKVIAWSKDGKPSRLVGTHTDISASKQLAETLQNANETLEHQVLERSRDLAKVYEQLLHADKLSAIGRLSASIAHEFNNPLQGVMTVIKGISRRVTLPEEDAKLLQMAITECNRMRDLIKSLQYFNRPTSGKIGLVNIHATIDSLLLLCNKECKNNGVIIETQYAEQLPQVRAVEDQIKQVLLNLLTNALSACEGGGVIVITTENHGQQIVIKVCDTGTGIRPEHIDHIFDPFFTTKSEVKGTGLGLSVSFGIIKKHGGRIEVASVVGQGATFTITLPVREVYHAE